MIDAIMLDIITDYLERNSTRKEAVAKLIKQIDIDCILNIDVTSKPENLLITDCYYAIKHLMECKGETSVKLS
jgi:hypothetical protein